MGVNLINSGFKTNAVCENYFVVVSEQFYVSKFKPLNQGAELLTVYFGININDNIVGCT